MCTPLPGVYTFATAAFGRKYLLQPLICHAWTPSGSRFRCFKWRYTKWRLRVGKTGCRNIVPTPNGKGIFANKLFYITTYDIFEYDLTRSDFSQLYFRGLYCTSGYRILVFIQGFITYQKIYLETTPSICNSQQHHYVRHRLYSAPQSSYNNLTHTHTYLHHHQIREIRSIWLNSD